LHGEVCENLSCGWAAVVYAAKPEPRGEGGRSGAPEVNSVVRVFGANELRVPCTQESLTTPVQAARLLGFPVHLANADTVAGLSLPLAIVLDGARECVHGYDALDDAKMAGRGRPWQAVAVPGGVVVRPART